MLTSVCNCHAQHEQTVSCFQCRDNLYWSVLSLPLFSLWISTQTTLTVSLSRRVSVRSGNVRPRHPATAARLLMTRQKVVQCEEDGHLTTLRVDNPIEASEEELPAADFQLNTAGATKESEKYKRMHRCDAKWTNKWIVYTISALKDFKCDTDISSINHFNVSALCVFKDLTGRTNTHTQRTITHTHTENHHTHTQNHHTHTHTPCQPFSRAKIQVWTPEETHTHLDPLLSYIQLFTSSFTIWEHQ